MSIQSCVDPETDTSVIEVKKGYPAGFAVGGKLLVFKGDGYAVGRDPEETHFVKRLPWPIASAWSVAAFEDFELVPRSVDGARPRGL